MAGAKAQIERERKKENRDARNERKIETGNGGEGESDGSERDGVSQPEECLSWQRRGSGTGSVQSSQVSPREGDILLRGVHVPRSIGALRRAHRGPVARFVIFSSILYPLKFPPLALLPIALRVRGLFSPLDNAYPEARARACTHANPLCCS